MQRFIHQPSNSVGSDVFNSFVYGNIDYDMHIHKGYELAVVFDGPVTAEIPERKLELNRGDAFFVPSFFPHAYHAENVSLLVVVFAASYAPTISNIMNDRVPKDPAFKLSNETFALIKRFFVEDVKYERGGKTVKLKKPEQLKLKAGLYAVAAELLSAGELVSLPRNETLVFKVLEYVEKNFTEDISLKSMSDELGYDYCYVSRKLSSALNVNFKDLVNQYRCEKAIDLMKTNNMTLTTAAYNSGFQSIRSFNRVFKELTGITPTEAKKK